MEFIQLETILLLSHFVEVLHRIFWCTELYECHCWITYCLIPIVLKIEYLLPNGKGYEWGVIAENWHVVCDFYLVSHHSFTLLLGISFIIVILINITIVNGSLWGKSSFELRDCIIVFVLTLFTLLLDACQTTKTPKDVEASSFTLTFIALKKFIKQWEKYLFKSLLVICFHLWNISNLYDTTNDWETTCLNIVPARSEKGLLQERPHF